MALVLYFARLVASTISEDHSSLHSSLSQCVHSIAASKVASLRLNGLRFLVSSGLAIPRIRFGVSSIPDSFSSLATASGGLAGREAPAAKSSEPMAAGRIGGFGCWYSVSSAVGAINYRNGLETVLWISAESP